MAIDFSKNTILTRKPPAEAYMTSYHFEDGFPANTTSYVKPRGTLLHIVGWYIDTDRHGKHWYRAIGSEDPTSLNPKMGYLLALDVGDEYTPEQFRKDIDAWKSAHFP